MAQSPKDPAMTTTPKPMSLSELNIAIAERCGWKPSEPFNNAYDGTLTQTWTHPSSELTVDGCAGHMASELPDFTGSLDAMHEALLTITEKVKQAAFAEELTQLLNRKFDGEFRFLGATPYHVATADALTLAVAFAIATGILTPEQAREILKSTK